MTYRFRMLGPVQVLRDGQQVALGPPKRRAMLATLLLERNRPVCLARLAAAVWAGSAPNSAVANLRSHAAALRRVLPGRLTSFPVAYQLQVKPGECDVDQFLELATAGRRALADGDAPTALTRLSGAMALWRGDAGDDLPRDTFLNASLIALNENRLDAFEDHAAALLAVGAHADLPVALRHHLNQHPLRERAWYQLMSALYRSGNVAAALETYHDARAILKERLGLEPSPELAALHRAMLDRAPSLSAPQVRQTPPSLGTLCLLPPDVDHLHGRDTEMALAQDAVRAAAKGKGPAAVAILGPIGVGKTAFAIRLARTLADQFTDGQIGLSLSGAGPTSSSEVIASILAAHDFPTGTEVDLTRYRSLLSTRRLLILLDDVCGPHQIRSLIPAGTGSALVVVSRRRLATLDVATRFELGPLDRDAATRLLADEVGQARLDSDRRSTASIVARCHGLPLALRIVAARLRTRPAWPLTILAEQLASNPLDVLQLEDLSLRDRLAADLSCLSKSAARTLALLATRPGGQATAAELAHGLTEPIAEATAVLERLFDLGLVDSSAPGTYRIDGLLRRYASEQSGRSQVPPAKAA